MDKKNYFLSGNFRHFPAMILFLVFLSIGWLLHRDYGLHWDSWSQYELGLINYNFVFRGDNQLLSYKYRYYGPIFELILLFLTGSMDIRDMFFAQHFLTYCSFLIGLIGFYILIFRISHKTSLAFLGCLMIILNPRILADSFYNTKDIPFMSAFILSILTLHILYSRLRWTSIFLHAVSSAIMIAIRMQGVLIYALSLFVFLILFMQKKDSKYRKNILLLTSAYLIFSFLVLVIIFPALWNNPIREIVYGLRQLSRFPWPGGSVLYRGAMIDATDLPWHYVPNWVLITTPVIISIFFVIGLFFLMFCLCTRPSDLLNKDFWFSMSFLWLSIPVFSVILFKSVLYDGWRHLFFIYPAYVLIAIYGLDNLLSYQIPGIIARHQQFFIYGAIALGLIHPVLFIIQNHPHEYVYFNQFAGQDYQEIKQKYETDYWGLSYFDSLKYLVELDKRLKIPIKFDNTPGKLNVMMLPVEDADRIAVKSELTKADYFITNYRWHPDEYDLALLHSIRVNGANVNSIYWVYP